MGFGLEGKGYGLVLYYERLNKLEKDSFYISYLFVISLTNFNLIKCVIKLSRGYNRKTKKTLIAI